MSPIRSLIGLRGIGALAIVIAHALLAALAQPPGSAESHWLLWLGREAVMLFFVLSGFVLTGMMRRAPVPARAYYASRFVRLYVPAWAAIALAAALHAAVGWHHVVGANWWVNLHDTPIGLHQAWRDATLLRAGGYEFFAAIWSLKWEAAFSILLPLYVAGAARVERRPAVGYLVAFAAIALGARWQAPAYLPVFFMGSVLAVHHEAFTARWTITSLAGRWAFTAVVVLLTTSDLWFTATSMNGGLVRALGDLGATGILAIAIASRSARSFLEARWMQRLGLWSFSLYLVHEPIVISLANRLGPRPSAAPLVALAVVTSLAVAALFYHQVERRSHDVSQRIKSSRKRSRAVAAKPKPTASPS